MSCSKSTGEAEKMKRLHFGYLLLEFARLEELQYTPQAPSTSCKNGQSIFLESGRNK